MSTYAGVTNCQKQYGFLAHPVYSLCVSQKTPTWNRTNIILSVINPVRPQACLVLSVVTSQSCCCFPLYRIILRQAATRRPHTHTLRAGSTGSSSHRNSRIKSPRRPLHNVAWSSEAKSRPHLSPLWSRYGVAVHGVRRQMKSAILI